MRSSKLLGNCRSYRSDLEYVYLDPIYSTHTHTTYMYIHAHAQRTHTHTHSLTLTLTLTHTHTHTLTHSGEYSPVATPSAWSAPSPWFACSGSACPGATGRSSLSGNTRAKTLHTCSCLHWAQKETYPPPPPPPPPPHVSGVRCVASLPSQRKSTTSGRAVGWRRRQRSRCGRLSSLTPMGERGCGHLSSHYPSGRGVWFSQTILHHPNAKHRACCFIVRNPLQQP